MSAKLLVDAGLVFRLLILRWREVSSANKSKISNKVLVELIS